MIASDSLFRLIKSLSSGERRHFQLCLSQYQNKQKNNYIKLFHAISLQTEYDEEKLKRRYRKEAFTGRLPVEKNYLFRQIMKTLVAYHANGNVDSELSVLLNQSSILFEKGLFKEYEKTVRKSRKLAEKYEKYRYLLEIIVCERRLIRNGIISGELVKKNMEEKIVFDNLSTVYKQMWLNSEISDIIKESMTRSTDEASVIRNFLKHHLLKIRPVGFSFHAKRYYYSALSNCYLAVGDYKQNIVATKKMLENFLENKHFIDESRHIFISTIRNRQNSLIASRRYNEAIELIMKFDDLMRSFYSNEKSYLLNDIKDTWFGYFLLANIYKGNFEKIGSVVADCETWLNENKGMLSKSRLPGYYIILVNYYFGVENYRSALYWLNNYLNDSQLRSFRQELQGFSRIIFIIIHYKLENMELVESLIRSTYRFLRKQKSLYKVEEAVLQFLKGFLGRDFTLGNIIKAYQKLHSELVKLSDDNLESVALRQFDLISWLESEISNQPFAEIVRAKASKLQ